MLKLDRNKTVWVSSHGEARLVKHLSDEHVANIIEFIARERRDEELENFFREEAYRRGLTNEFLDRAQIPHVAPDGKWHMWDFDKHDDVVVSKKVARR